MIIGTVAIETTHTNQSDGTSLTLSFKFMILLTDYIQQCISKSLPHEPRSLMLNYIDAQSSLLFAQYC